MKEIAVETVMRMQKERSYINNLNFREIVWTYQGKPLDIARKLLDKWEFCGLSNVDFVTSNYLGNTPWVESLLPGEVSKE